MTPELLLLRVLLNNNLYIKYKEYIDIEYIKEYYRELHSLYILLEELHKENKDISLEEYILFFYTKYPNANKDTYTPIFETLKASEVSQESALTLINQLISRKRSLKLSELAFKVAQGIATQETLDAFLKESPQQITETTLPLTPVNNDIELLLQDKYKSVGLRWRLDCLNKSLGSLRPGDFGFLFARPETGKTTFLASEVSHMLETSPDSKIVWLNNEEDGWKVMLRLYQATFGVESEKILSNTKGAKNAFLERYGKRFYMFDEANIGKRDVEKIVEVLKPSLVVYDQIDKIKGFAADREDLRLGSIYQWARELAKGNHAAIGVCQADGTGEGVRYLTMEHVANAKTSKQAEGDFIFGIGKTNDGSMEYARFINVCKNKLIGDKDSNPKLRHGRFEVLIEPEVARYRDVIKYD